jgi:hypothetical protein
MHRPKTVVPDRPHPMTKTGGRLSLRWACEIGRRARRSADRLSHAYLITRP